MRRPGPDEWAKLISEYDRGGFTQKEFVAKYDVSLGTFQYWLYKRAKLASKIDVNSAPRFLPVEVVASPATQSRDGVIEVALRSGVALRFAVGTDTRYLAELIASLG
jgi:hypothetical protein